MTAGGGGDYPSTAGESESGRGPQGEAMTDD